MKSIAAVGFLSGLPRVDPDRIAALAICQGSSEMLGAAANDARIRVLATVAGHYRDHEGDLEWLTEDGYGMSIWLQSLLLTALLTPTMTWVVMPAMTWVVMPAMTRLRGVFSTRLRVSET